MTKMLICPKCGEYQEDTTNIRMAGVMAKKAGMYAGKFGIKMGTKLVAGALGGSDDFSQRAAGIAGSEIANYIGLNPDKVSISDVKYKCSSCNHYWVGLDNPSYFNEIQIKTVAKKRQEAIQFNKKEFFGSIKMTFLTIIGIGLSIWIWNARIATEYTNMFGYPSTSYSWHYYIFWPLIIISAYFTLLGLKCIYDYYTYYCKYSNMSDIEYAKEELKLGNN